jgi:hypothetical protein
MQALCLVLRLVRGTSHRLWLLLLVVLVLPLRCVMHLVLLDVTGADMVAERLRLRLLGQPQVCCPETVLLHMQKANLPCCLSDVQRYVVSYDRYQSRLPIAAVATTAGAAC